MATLKSSNTHPTTSQPNNSESSMQTTFPNPTAPPDPSATRPPLQATTLSKPPFHSNTETPNSHLKTSTHSTDSNHQPPRHHRPHHRLPRNHTRLTLRSHPHPSNQYHNLQASLTVDSQFDTIGTSSDSSTTSDAGSCAASTGWVRAATWTV